MAVPGGVGSLFAGVEVVWAAWAAGVAVLAAGAVKAARATRRPALRELAADERGMTYTLSYVMSIPVYLFFLLMAYETTWLLVAKIGALYAAHAGARSTAVWATMDPAGDREDRVGQSVATALAPFATASRAHLAAAGGAPAEAHAQAEEFVLAYGQYSAPAAAAAPRPRPYRLANTPPDALRRYYLNAAARVTYHADVDPAPGGRVTVTVTYRAPLRIPGPARWLGRTGPNPEFRVTAHATLPNEAADTPDHTLGIPYRSATRVLP